MKELILKSVVEKGLLFVVLAVALYSVWNKSTAQDAILMNRIENLEQQNTACSEKFQQIIISEWEKSNLIIQANNILLSDLQTKIK